MQCLELFFLSPRIPKVYWNPIVCFTERDTVRSGQRLAAEPKCLTDTRKGPYPISHLSKRKGKGDSKKETDEGDGE